MGYSLAAVNQWNLIALALYFYMLFLFILNNGILYAYYVDLCRSMQNICNWFINRRIFNRICLYCWWTTVKLYHYIYNRNSSHDEILPRNGFPPNGSRRDFLLQSESSETAFFLRPEIQQRQTSPDTETQSAPGSRKRPFWDHRPGEVQWDMCETWVNWSCYICIGVIKRGNGKSMSLNENHKFRKVNHH